MITTVDFTKGMILKIDGNYWEITECQFVSPGKGSAFTRTRLKNLKDGRTMEQTYKSGENFEDVEYDKRDAVFLYKDRKNAVFAVGPKKERISLPLETVDDKLPYLKENTELEMMFAEGQCLTIMLPKKVNLKVVMAPPAMKGNTAGSATKTVTLETGLEINVPDFINEGDVIRINTEMGKYSERVQE